MALPLTHGSAGKTLNRLPKFILSFHSGKLLNGSRDTAAPAAEP